MKNLLICSLFLLVGIGARAQASFGFANTNTPGLSDTVLMSSTITYGVSVMNTGTQAFSGTFTVYVAIQDSSIFLPTMVDSVDVQTASFQAGDSSGVVITHDISPAKFMDGNNTVVIWPASPGFSTTDSIIRDIVVITFQEVDELAVDQLNIYPNPVSSDLFIRSTLEVESVRILDLNGKLLLTTTHSFLQLGSFQNGIYIIEVETAEGKILRKKITLHQ